jgi:16S rRNA (cytosine967-C5)-methyltransferase
MADAGLSARALARQVLRRVEQGDAYATLALGGALARSRLAPPDRALATEIVYGVLRHRSRLDRALASHAPRGLAGLSRPALIALRAGAYQLLLTRVPAHAAVDDTVDAVREAAGARVAGFANAVLRRLAQVGEPPPPAGLEERLEALHSLPAWLARRVIAAVGRDEAEALAEAMNRPPPVSLRVALWRTTRAAVSERLLAERPESDIALSPLAPEAIAVRGAGAVEALAVHQEGLATVQDAAAQLVGRLCGAAPGERILDACAGVGGKSTHLAELARAAGGRAAIDAADLSRRKLDLAEDGARRLGLGEIRGVAADLTRDDAPLGAAYDRVLLDAPCSGLGVLRRHPEGKWRRREEEIGALAELQRRLLDALVPRLRPGGVLVYSVCTFTAEEGDDQLRRLLAARPDLVLDGEVLRTFPHRHDTDAFFAVRLRRRGGAA